MLAISILLVCFVPFAHYLHISLFPLLVCWFLVLAFACTHMERGCMELGHGLPGHVDISQTAMFSRFRGLASSIWLCTILNPLPSSLISLLDRLY